MGRFATYLGTEPQVAAHQRRDAHPRRRVDVVEASAVERHRPVRVHGVLRGRGVPAPHEIAYTADLAAGRLVVRALDGHGHAAGDVVVAAAVQIGQDARPHQQHHTTVAVVLAYHGAAHFDQRRPQRVKARYVEFGCGVKTSGGDGSRRRQHPVAADQFAGVVLADQQVIAVFVEAVGIQPVGGAGQANPGSEVNTS